MVKIKVSAHQEIARSAVGTSKGTTARIIRQAHALCRRDRVEKMSDHKPGETCGANDSGIQSLIELVVHSVVHLIDSALVAFKVNERINHIKLILIFNEHSIICGRSRRRFLIVTASSQHEHRQHSAKSNRLHQFYKYHLSHSGRNL